MPSLPTSPPTTITPSQAIRLAFVWPLLLLLPAIPAQAEANATNQIVSFWEFLTTTDRLTGSWGGFRTKLEDHGVKFSLYYNHFFAYKDNGGAVPTDEGAHSGSLDFFAQLDFEKMQLIPGGEVLTQVKTHYSYNINRDVGALGDPIDDADGDRGPYIDQLYYQQSLFQKWLQIRAGYLDQQTILDRNAYANSEDKQFMNAFLDNNNAIVPLAIGPGAAVFLNPFPWLSLALSMADAEARLYHDSLDTTFDGDWEFFGYFESDLHFDLPSPNGPLPGHYRFGLIFDPREKAYFDTPPGQSHLSPRDFGGYLSFDQLAWAEPNTVEQGLGLFARYGWRSGDVNRIEHFWSAGAQYRGLIPRRDPDVLAFGVYSAIGSRDYADFINEEFDRETGYEFYYLVQLTPALTVTPGFQYISQPGALQSRADVMVGALRLRFTF